MAKEYEIAKPAGRCAQCDQELQGGQELMATIQESGESFRREDFCLACWSLRPRDEGALFGLWRTRVPEAKEKKRLLVDDEVIVNFFQRLEAQDDQAKVNFRFILTLVLMRKKLLVYDRMRKEADGREVWLLHFRGDERTHEVIDPHMDEQKIAEVSRQLNQVMEVDP